MLVTCGRVETESGGTRRRTGGEVKGKEANGVGSQAVFSLTRNSPSSVTTIVLPDPHSKKASTRLNWHPRQYKWTRPFRWKTESGFCACAITFRFHSTNMENLGGGWEGWRPLYELKFIHCQKSTCTWWIYS